MAIVKARQAILQEMSAYLAIDLQKINLNAPVSTLGINSIKGVDLLAHIEKTYQVEISPDEFFSGLTVNNILDKIMAVTDVKKTNKLIAFSDNQQGIWIDENTATKPLYNESAILDWQGKLDVALLQQAVKLVTQRHPLLRSAVVLQDFKPYFAIEEKTDVSINLHHVGQDLEKLRINMRQQAEQPFDLYRAPLFRIDIYQINHEEYKILFTFHHLIEDLWTYKIFLHDLSVFYNQLAKGNAINFSAPSADYQDFVREQSLLIAERSQSALDYWRTELHIDADTQPLTVKRQDKAGIAATLEYQLDMEASERLDAIYQSQQVTAFVLFFSLLFKTLFNLSDQNYITIGTPFLNRKKKEYFDVAGMFINTLPVQLSAKIAEQLPDLLQTLSEKIKALKEYEWYPFPRLVNELKIKREYGKHPIFQTLFLYYDETEQTGYDFNGAKASVAAFETQTSRYDLEFTVLKTSHGYRIKCKYDTSLFDQEVAKGILAKYVKNLPIEKAQQTTAPISLPNNENALKFSLFYFASSAKQCKQTDKYELLTRSAKLADEYGLHAIWTPERHFHEFGGLFPNPMTMSAYLAAITKRIRIRTGSVVVPLHHPVRVAEELALVDNLSNGRVDAGVTWGWNPNDFILENMNFENRRQITYDDIEIIQKLWKGETVAYKNGKGDLTNIEIFPQPLQKELNMWLTCTDFEQGFIDCGKLGVNVITALLFQDIETLQAKIQLYRDALKQYHPNKKGRVTLMLHTFVHDDTDHVKELVKEPMLNYLKSAYNLWAREAKQLDEFSPEKQRSILEFAFERYYQQSSLLGSKDKCIDFCERLIAIGVDEIACLIDFGVNTEETLVSVKNICDLNQTFANKKFIIRKQRYQPYLFSSLQEKFVEQPDNIAVIDQNQALTYAELNHVVQQLCAQIHALQVQRQDKVAVLLSRSLMLPAVIMALRNLGAIYLPVDSKFPHDRIKYMLENSQAKLILCDKKTRSLAQGFRLPIYELQDVAFYKNSTLTLPVVKHYQDDIAYLIYTSGSTGHPKGVQIYQTAFDNFLQSMKSRPGIHDDDLMFAGTTISFDISLLELILPLTVGARIYICDEEVMSNGFSLRDELDKVQPSIIQATPSTWKMLLKAGWTGDRHIKILSGGEALFKTLAQELLKNAGEVWNMYGPTETTIWSSCEKITVDQHAIFLGTPIANTDLFVLDENLNIVTQGEGELYIGGSGLAAGYLNLDKLTAERFVFIPSLNQKVYKTSDWVSVDAEKHIEYKGRCDNQTKIRGYLIEPNEINKVLLESNYVADCATITYENSQKDKCLLSYVVAKPDYTENKLLAFIKSKLPDYMIPKKIILIEELPLTDNAKLDLKKLPKPFFPVIEEEHVVLSSVQSLWKKVLNMQVNKDTDFFQAGGNSLLLTELLLRVKEIYPDNPLMLRDFLQKPTLGNMLDLLLTKTTQENQSDLIEEDIHYVAPATITKAYQFSEPTNILITGATGFIGAYLLVHLLKHTKAKLYCLVRAKSLQAAKEKLIAAFTKYEIYTPELENKVDIVLGDLEYDQFGMDNKHYRALAKKIDFIYHLGANVNFVFPYQALRNANVLGTERVLQFAAELKIKRLCFVSTYAVYDSFDASEKQIIHSADELPPINTLRNGYEQTKWMSEYQLRHAMQQIPITIVRPGRVVMSYDHHILNTNDLFYRLLRFAVDQGTMPDIDGLVNNIDVESLCEILVRLASTERSINASYNAMNKYSLHWKDIINYFNSRGIAIKQVPFDEWIGYFNRLMKVDGHAYKDLMPLIQGRFANENVLQTPRFDVDDLCDVVSKNHRLTRNDNQEILRRIYLSVTHK